MRGHGVKARIVTDHNIWPEAQHADLIKARRQQFVIESTQRRLADEQQGVTVTELVLRFNAACPLKV